MSLRILLLAVVVAACSSSPDGQKESSQDASQVAVTTAPETTGYVHARYSETPMVIDGKAIEPVWAEANWHPIDNLWLGSPIQPGDFEGRFKVAWTTDFLYVLAEIKDDSLFDQHADPKYFYWDDDCFEVFIDEDHSGGNHQLSHNAFAYHIGIDYQVADIGPDEEVHLYTDHVKTQRTSDGDTYLWECAFKIYTDSYQDNSTANQRVKLTEGKKMGFMVAYCDNDSSEERENFFGSVVIEGEDKNRGWIDADVFGTVELVK